MIGRGRRKKRKFLQLTIAMKTLRPITEKDENLLRSLTRFFSRKDTDFFTILPDGKPGLVLKSDSCLVFTLKESTYQRPSFSRIRIDIFRTTNASFDYRFCLKFSFNENQETLKRNSSIVRNIFLKSFRSLSDNFTDKEADSLISENFSKFIDLRILVLQVIFYLTNFVLFDIISKISKGGQK